MYRELPGSKFFGHLLWLLSEILNGCEFLLALIFSQGWGWEERLTLVRKYVYLWPWFLTSLTHWFMQVWIRDYVELWSLLTEVQFPCQDEKILILANTSVDQVGLLIIALPFLFCLAQFCQCWVHCVPVLQPRLLTAPPGCPLASPRTWCF